MDSTRNTVDKSKQYSNLTEVLINEVRKRPILWGKKHLERSKCRLRVNKEWEAVATVLNRKPCELKSKWRNIKDTFHREAKKVHISPTDVIDQPIVNYYTGQWLYFDTLMFLWDNNRHLPKNIQEEVFIQIDASNLNANDIKEETNVSDSNDGDLANDSQYQDDTQNNMRIDDSTRSSTPRTILNTDPIANEDSSCVKDLDQWTEKKKRCEMNCGVIEDSEIDEDLHFAKSLVPFMRKLNPIRKLIVRNEMHSLLLKELLCERCKSIGPQPNCRCNL